MALYLESRLAAGRAGSASSRTTAGDLILPRRGADVRIRSASADRRRPRDAAVSLLMRRRSSSTRPTRPSSVPFILMGVGIALTMSPMSTAAMNAVARRRRLASGLLSVADDRRHVRRRRPRAIFQSPGSLLPGEALAGVGVRPRIDAIGEQLGSWPARRQRAPGRCPGGTIGSAGRRCGREAFVRRLATSDWHLANGDQHEGRDRRERSADESDVPAGADLGPARCYPAPSHSVPSRGFPRVPTRGEPWP